MKSIPFFKASFLTVFLMVLAGSLQAEPVADMRFVLVTNEGVVGGSFEIRLQIKANQVSYGLGSSNLVFTYNSEALNSPVLQAVHNFSGGAYRQMVITEPVLGRVSTNIELRSANQGTIITDSYIDVATIHFTISNPSASSNVEWRITTPSPTIVFQDDEATVISNGNLEGLDVLLPISGGEGSAIVTDYEFHQNYPNPFNPSTQISYAIPAAGAVQIIIYDVLGQEIRTLVNENMASGRYQVTWDATDNGGRRVSSGVYIYRIKAGSFTQHRKMMLLR